MAYTAYKIFNRAEFEATGLVSRNYTLNLEGVGETDILVTKGNVVAMLFEGIFLPVKLEGVNPFEFEGHAAWEDANADVWLGIEVA